MTVPPLPAVLIEPLVQAALPEALAGSATGVFVGLSTTDYGVLQTRELAAVDAYTGTGSAASIASRSAPPACTALLA